MAGFDSFQPIIELPPLPALILPVFEEQTDSEIWPLPGAPEPNLHARGLTEARCVVEFYYAGTSDKRLDALKHLGNICALKARRALAYWNPRPYLKFVGTKTARQDWENSDPYSPLLQKINTLGWFVTTLPDHILKYSPQNVTKRELLELARIRDKDLLHVCHALVCDLLNESAKQALHEIQTTALWERGGQEFYFDGESETPIEAQHSASMAPTGFAPDYASATQLLVKDKRLRAALPKSVRQTLELVFRKLAGGVEATEVISSVAAALDRDERTVRRRLATARTIATDISDSSSNLLQMLGSLVLPS